MIRSSKRRTPRRSSRTARSPNESTPRTDGPIKVSNLSLHELFEQQTRDVLDRADVDEEQKQSILVALSCPCCGIGGLSYTVKLKPRK